MTSYNVSTATANFEAIEAAEIALGRTWAAQNLVRQNGAGFEMYCADDEIERTFWGGDWRPASHYEAIGIAEALAASDIDIDALADEADWLDYIDTRESIRFGFSMF